jgi:formylmethanofuran dehydrogenase subunit D
LFKNVKNSSPFGECIIAALKDKSSSADTVYIGSGFFQEEEKPKTKSISNIQMGSAVTLLDAFRDSNIEDVHLIGSYI